MANYMDLIIVLFAFYAYSKADGTGCDDGWLPYNNNCYLINTLKHVSRTAASSECNSHDSSLLRIKSQDQLTWLQQQFKTYPSSGYWTDLNDIPKVTQSRQGTGVWKWGQSEYADNSLIQWNKSPANDGQSKCAGVNIQGKLADVNCMAKEGYICKYKSTTGCVLGWLSGTGRCYWIGNTSDVSDRQTWAQAKTLCEGKAGGAVNPKLLVIADQNDVTFLTGVLPYLSQTTKIHWIGLQSTTVGSWAWYTGGTVDPRLAKWQQEPDNVAGIENCGVLRMTGKFSDRDCSSSVANFVCYKPQYNYSPTDNIGCGPWLRAGIFCYTFMSGQHQDTWLGARGYCQMMGADLMKVDSFDKKTWLQQQMLDPANQRQFWTGLNDRQTEGSYIWADGTPVNNTYIKWNQEPNDFMGSEDCALIYTTGQYNDNTCSGYSAAICELDSQITCKPGWTANGGNCYLFTQYKNASLLYNQNEAAAYCATFASSATVVGKLLSVNDQNEKAFIKSQVKSMADNVYGWWTSLNDRQVEGLWSFNDGTMLDPKLVDWSGEPSTNTGDNCGLITTSASYHEQQCTTKLSYICERYATGYGTGVNLKANVVGGLVMLLVAAFIR